MFLTLFLARNQLLQKVNSQGFRVTEVSPYLDAEEVEALLLRGVLSSEGGGGHPLHHHRIIGQHLVTKSWILIIKSESASFCKIHMA